MTAKSIAQIKADIDAHLQAHGASIDPSPVLRKTLFDILDSLKAYNAPDPHLIRLTYPGIPSPNALVLGEVFVVDVAFPANFAGSQFRCLVAPHEAYMLRILKNGDEVGAIEFAAGQTSATISTSDGESLQFAPGDILQLVTQASLDVILGLFGALAGTRV
ncbi:hypothetical protein IYW40_15280 [Methylocystis sp. H4A]|uniref:hypothetical protein n=1 Tax=Methylocystis sp. H4A TaxID=2785788 RepID=UPI0018C34997|nr:hypothetical protein [Methylocystis sp. H4A]MBG0802828.1 hypothetical protein [Methylocystis sp. H4A]